MKRINNITWPGTLRITGVAIVVGIAAAYTPALGNGSTWSLPYYGSVAGSGYALNVVNSGTGVGIYGESTGTTAFSLGIEGYAAGSSGIGVYGFANSQGVEGYCTSTYGQGVYGYAPATSGQTRGVLGVSASGSGSGVYAQATNGGTGLYATSDTGYGVFAYTGSQGTTSDLYPAVMGWSTSTSQYTCGVQGRSDAQYGYGVCGSATADNGTGVEGNCNSSNGGYGVFGVAPATGGTGTGVYGLGPTGVLGICSNSTGLAGSFTGNVLITGNLQVNGTINKSAVGFKIDHPLDPTHKFLMHSCVESNEMMNIYRGNATLDSDGKAIVNMPAWFQAENTDFSYQLTAIGMPAPGLYVSKKIEKNQFEVAGGASGMEVSWQVTGARNDKYAIAHPLKIELDKPAADQGKYIRPEEYGQPETKMIGYVKATHHAARAPRTMPRPTVQALPHAAQPVSLTVTPTTPRLTAASH